MAIGIFTLRQQLRGLLSTNWTGAKTTYVEYLVVGGGGSGGTYTSGTGYVVGNAGVNSSLGSVIAVGGGYGGKYNGIDGGPGGSGGGGGATGTTAVSAGGAGVAGQGNAGSGGSLIGINYVAGGGGGAGTIGLTGATLKAGNGGAGIASAISGTVTPYGGGGGGSTGSNGAAAGTGGVGGGGAGGAGANGTAGQANTGGGGGGSDSGIGAGAGGGGGGGVITGLLPVNAGSTYNISVGGGGAAVGSTTPGVSGAGGSGIVIVSYLDIYPALTTGGATSPTVSTSGSGSMYFNGTTDYIYSASTGAAFDYGTGNLTIEFWIYPVTGAVNAYQPALFSNHGNGSWNDDGNGIRTHFGNTIFGGGSFTQLNYTSSIPTAQWSHVAIVRTGNTIVAYLNGAANGSVSFSGSLGSTTAQPTVAMADGIASNGGGNSFPNCYISNFRIVKGVAVYSGAFTPPTGPLQTIQPAGPSGSNINAVTGTQASLLLNTVSGAQFANAASNSYTMVKNGTPSWNQLSPFATGLGYKNRVYTWAPTVSAGSSATGTFTV